MTLVPIASGRAGVSGTEPDYESRLIYLLDLSRLKRLACLGLCGQVRTIFFQSSINPRALNTPSEKHFVSH